MTEEQLQEVQRQMAARMANATDVRFGERDVEYVRAGVPTVDRVYDLSWHWRVDPDPRGSSASFTVKFCPDTVDALVDHMCAKLEEGNPHLPPSARLEIVDLPTEVTGG